MAECRDARTVAGRLRRRRGGAGRAAPRGGAPRGLPALPASGSRAERAARDVLHVAAQRPARAARPAPAKRDARRSVAAPSAGRARRAARAAARWCRCRLPPPSCSRSRACSVFGFERQRRGARHPARRRSRQVLSVRAEPRRPTRRPRARVGRPRAAGRSTCRAAQPAEQLELLGVRRCLSSMTASPRTSCTAGAGSRCRSSC